MKPDEKFSYFTIIKQLGYGGMATVYRAMDSRSGKDVALKILHDQYAQDDEVIRRFNREADIFYTLKHPNIVPIVDHGEHEGKFYIAMGYMAGGNLFERFSRPTTVDSDFTISVLKQVAGALDFAHAKGVIHRDLKLENILLDDDNTAYLADFGIAFLSDATRLTTHQTIAGTPLYMSPEQALGLSVTPSSDIYSLAVMAYLMVTGFHPFTGRDPYTILNQHVSQPPPVPTSVNETLPMAVDRVLLKGLAKKPDERYRAATQLINEFGSAIQWESKTTQTLIRLDDPNPQAAQTIDEYKDTLIAQPDTPTVALNPNNNNSTNRLLIIMGGLIALAILVVGVVVALTSNNNSNEAFAAIAQTQARLELTSTAIALPTSTATPELDATALTIRGSTLRESPEPGSAELGELKAGVTVEMIGRTGPGDFIEIIAPDDGQTGFIKADSLETDYEMMLLPVTHVRDPDSDNRPPRDPNNIPDDGTNAPPDNRNSGDRG